MGCLCCKVEPEQWCPICAGSSEHTASDFKFPASWGWGVNIAPLTSFNVPFLQRSQQVRPNATAGVPLAMAMALIVVYLCRELRTYSECFFNSQQVEVEALTLHHWHLSMFHFFSIRSRCTPAVTLGFKITMQLLECLWQSQCRSLWPVCAGSSEHTASDRHDHQTQILTLESWQRPSLLKACLTKSYSSIKRFFEFGSSVTVTAKSILHQVIKVILN